MGPSEPGEGQKTGMGQPIKGVITPTIIEYWLLVWMIRSASGTKLTIEPNPNDRLKLHTAFNLIRSSHDAADHEIVAIEKGKVPENVLSGYKKLFELAETNPEMKPAIDHLLQKVFDAGVSAGFKEAELAVRVASKRKHK